MNLFKKYIDKKETLLLIRKVLQGIGRPHFDEGTGIQKKAGMTNIVLIDEDHSKLFEGSSLDKSFDKNMFDKTILSFSLPNGDYIAKVESNEFTVTYLANGKKASIYNEFNESDLEIVLTDDEDTDKVAVKSLIESFLKKDVGLFDGEDKSSYPDTIMGLGYDGAYCHDRELGWLLFGFITKQMYFLRPTEANKLLELFMIDHKPVRFEHIEKLMRLQMSQTFNILKENGHDINNEVESNDMENFLYYVEKDDIQGNVYINQNFLFLVARNTKTNVVKAWNSMKIVDYWMEKIIDDSYVDEHTNVFNVANYLQSFSNALYANNYEYPFEFNTYGYLKSVDKLLEEFETAENGLIYDSEKGFFPAMFMSFNSLMLEIDTSLDLITEEYEIEKEALIETEMDINSPDYYIRGKAHSGLSRSSALWSLFMLVGTGTYWDGKKFTTSGITTFKDYEATTKENDYSPLYRENPFAYGVYGMLFELPDDLPEDWKKVVFEMAAYLTNWIIKNPTEQESLLYGDKVKEIFEKYYDAEVLEKVNLSNNTEL